MQRGEIKFSPRCWREMMMSLFLVLCIDVEMCSQTHICALTIQKCFLFCCLLRVWQKDIKEYHHWLNGMKAHAIKQTLSLLRYRTIQYRIWGVRPTEVAKKWICKSEPRISWFPRFLRSRILCLCGTSFEKQYASLPCWITEQTNPILACSALWSVQKKMNLVKASKNLVNHEILKSHRDLWFFWWPQLPCWDTRTRTRTNTIRILAHSPYGVLQNDWYKRL